MSLGLCPICRIIFEGPPVLNEEQPHHDTPDGFIKAASTCYICRTITQSDLWVELERRVKLSDAIPEATWFLVAHTFRGSDDEEVWYKLTIDHDWGDRDGELYPPSNDGSDDLPDFYPETPICEFRVYSSSHVIDKQTLPLGLQDAGMLDLPKLWYRRCVQEHPLCKPPDPTFRPTRLIEILDEVSVRLIEAKSERLKESYVAFSHCWGMAKTLKLLAENKTRLQSRTNDTELPTSYREALLDSFDDWQQEALTMKDVYQNSILNLCASAAAENLEASFTSRDVSIIPPCKISPYWEDPNESWYIAKFDMYDEEVENSPLISRAWVVQEHFLSHRSLHLTKTQLWYGCRQQVACETFPVGYPRASMDPSFARALSNFKEKLPADEEKSQQDTRWYNIVEDYARCGLTVATDKLIAFAGVAQSFTSVFPEDQYAAGMWRSQMPLSLCWGVLQHSHKYRPRTYIAPSWSWASVKGVIQIPLIYDRVCYGNNKMKAPLNIHCQVADVHIGLKDARYIAGQVSSGQLDLRAHLIGPVDWENSSPDCLKIVVPHASNVGDEIGFEDGGEVNFDETSRDGAVRMAWLDGSSMEEDENANDTPQTFLIMSVP